MSKSRKVWKWAALAGGIVFSHGCHLDSSALAAIAGVSIVLFLLDAANTAPPTA